MQYNIKLDMTLDGASLQTLLQTLDNGPHRMMRGLIDTILMQARAQEEAAQQAEQPQEVPPPPAQP